MALTPGTRIGPYEIINAIGSGGMGEVYRARDTRLGRDVAIKTLPHDRLADESRRRRFVQEARAASALNHPNIVTIHEIESIDGLDVIVMELVTGKTLKEIIRPRMKLTEILDLAIPIADALARAHAVGIVHRDLKPANVMVNADGTVKILDFGLAKVVDVESSANVDTDTLTASSGAAGISVAGTVVGTPAYMSPEQAIGAVVDARSDIFSFGTMLYEMVTARRAFPGNSVTETLAAVVRAEPPPPSQLAPGVPKELERLILRCLRKDPTRRVQHMADVRIELLDLKEESAINFATSGAVRPQSKRARLLAPALVGIGALALASWLWFARPRQPDDPPLKLVPVTSMQGNEVMPSLSPDGDSVAFSWDGETRADATARDRDIFITLIGATENLRLTLGPEDDWSPSWSPDGRQIAFVRSRPGQVMKGTIYVVSPLGGPARAIGALTPVFSQLSWSPDSRWLAAPGYRVLDDPSSKPGGLQLISVDGGQAHHITEPRGVGYDAYPAFSSDGRRLAYASCEKEFNSPCDVFVVDLGPDLQPTGQARRLTRMRVPIHGIAWAPDERSIVFALATMSIYGSGMGAQLWRVSVDSESAPERVNAAPFGSFAPSVSRSRRRLVFAQDHSDFDILRFNGANPATPVVNSSLEDYAPSFSPNGSRIAFESSRSGLTREIWVSDPDGSNAVQITRSAPGHANGNPTWGPKGQRILYTDNGVEGTGEPDLFTMNADGTDRHQVTHDALVEAVATWSHDGHWAYYRQDGPDGTDIFRVSVDSGSKERLTKHGGLYPIVSWDDKTLVLTKTETWSALYRMPAGGGNEEQIVDCVASRALAVTPPNNLYYLGCPSGSAAVTVHKRELTTGHDEVVGTLAGPLDKILGLAVSPDGKTILYAPSLTRGADLMMLENFR